MITKDPHANAGLFLFLRQGRLIDHQYEHRIIALRLRKETSLSFFSDEPTSDCAASSSNDETALLQALLVESARREQFFIQRLLQQGNSIEVGDVLAGKDA